VIGVVLLVFILRGFECFFRDFELVCGVVRVGGVKSERFILSGLNLSGLR